MPQAQSEQSTFLSFFGASLLSAAGSLPQHIGPLIIIAVVADGRLTVERAGWILSARALGDLVASVALPAMGVRHLSRSMVFAASLILLAAFTFTTIADGPAMLVAFLVIGASCGVLKFIGTVSASAYPHRAFAFTFRLALVLASAGLVVCALFATHAFYDFGTLIWRLTIVFTLLLAIAGLLYHPIVHSSSRTDQPSTAPSAHALCGLAILYCFFVGTAGFMAYAAQQTSARGVSIEETILAFGAMKLAAAVWMLIAAYALAKSTRKGPMVLEIALLLVAIWAVTFSQTALVFFAAFLLLEISLNSSSARLQSAIVDAAPQFSGQWLNAVILLGGVTGPALYGLAIGAGLEIVFITMSTVAICLALLWQLISSRKRLPLPRST